jgi:hypothetical protein
MDTAIWFDDERRAEAKQVCATCPVRAECTDHALAEPEPDGMWGGLSESERRLMSRGLPLNRPGDSGWLAACDRCGVLMMVARRPGRVQVRYCVECKPVVRREVLRRSRARRQGREATA